MLVACCQAEGAAGTMMYPGYSMVIMLSRPAPATLFMSRSTPGPGENITAAPTERGALLPKQTSHFLQTTSDLFVEAHRYPRRSPFKQIALPGWQVACSDEHSAVGVHNRRPTMTSRRARLKFPIG